MHDAVNADTVQVTFTVSSETTSEPAPRLDRFLAAQFEFSPQGHLPASRERLQHLIEQGQVTVNHQIMRKPATRLQAGDRVQVKIPPATPLTLPAEPETLARVEILFEDDHLMVVNKPAGMLTHAAGVETNTGTLVNALLAKISAPDPSRSDVDRLQEAHQTHLSGINGVLRPGIVHRLDKDTSGLLMIAKTDLAHRDLSAQIQAKTARRRYRALIHGHLTPDKGTITTHLARNPLVRNAVRVVPEHASGARLATTHWQVIATANAPPPETGRFTLVQLELDTGRTHQIRVHLSHLRHPVVGDPFYAKGAQPPKARWAHEGQLLQAFSLMFTHPVTHAPMHFELPPCLRLSQAADWLGVSWE